MGAATVVVSTGVAGAEVEGAGAVAEVEGSEVEGVFTATASALPSEVGSFLPPGTRLLSRL